MRGRVNFENSQVILGGIVDYLPEIKRCRRLLLIGCGTSYHSAVAVSILAFAFLDTWICKFIALNLIISFRLDSRNI